MATPIDMKDKAIHERGHAVVRITMLTLLLATLLCAGTGFAQEGNGEVFWDVHGSHHLDRLETRALIEKVCETSKSGCAGIRYGGAHFQVDVRTDTSTHMAIREAISAREPRRRTLSFKVSLLTASTDPLPKESRRVAKENKATASELQALA